MDTWNIRESVADVWLVTATGGMIRLAAVDLIEPQSLSEYGGWSLVALLASGQERALVGEYEDRDAAADACRALLEPPVA